MSSLTALAGREADAGFRQDERFARSEGSRPPRTAASAPPPQEESQADDPVSTAFAEGFALGAEQARAELLAAQAADEDAREGLAVALGRMEANMAETLRQRLLDTVMALCEQTLVPYAHDPQVLASRIERAAAMFSRADDERVIRLHPEDLKLVVPGLGGDWAIVPDATLTRGSLRVETASGGVEDGPAEWRRSLAEAFHAC